MPDIQLSNRLISFLIFLPVFFLSISVHEFSHALMANKFGDNTAKKLGRLTLNPIKHIDLIGSVIMPLASFASGFALIGWAKPIPVNRNNFRKSLTASGLICRTAFKPDLFSFIVYTIYYFKKLVRCTNFNYKHCFLIRSVSEYVFICV